jgi:hypothetical protein
MPLDWATQALKLEDIYRRHVPGLAARAYEDVEADLGRPIRRDGATLAALTDAIAADVPGVTATQRDRIAALTNQYTGDAAGLQAALAEIGAEVAARAQVIARSTVTRTINAATAAAVHADGRAACYLTDGTDDAPCAAINGTYRSATWVAAHTQAHPNCTRRAIAVDVAEIPAGALLGDDD